jgi:colanic acid biosynthesis glycosyl transferase WcaI
LIAQEKLRVRILLLTLYFGPDIAANAVIMTELAEDLAKLGHYLTVVTSMPHYDRNHVWPEYRGKLYVREVFGDLDVRRVYLCVPRRKESLLGRLLNYASFNALSVIAGTLEGRFDVVLTPSPPLTNGVAAFLLSRLHGVPYVYNVQDIYPGVAIRLGVLSNPIVIAFFKAIERFVYNKAAAVSVISEGFRRNLLSKSVPPQKIKVIPNFVDTEFVRPSSRHNGFSSEQGLDDKFVILFAGNIGLSQGLETVLKTAAKLRNQKDMLFLVVGNGAAKPRLMKYAQELDLENVRFLPFQPHKVIPNMYASSDVCLVPLRKGIAAESMPSKVYTITAAGRPLIASVDEDSDTHHFVQEARCGLWVEPEDSDALAEAIRALHADEELRERLGRNGRQYVEAHYTRQAIARQYHELLTTLGEMSAGGSG